MKHAKWYIKGAERPLLGVCKVCLQRTAAVNCGRKKKTTHTNLVGERFFTGPIFYRREKNIMKRSASPIDAGGGRSRLSECKHLRALRTGIWKRSLPSTVKVLSGKVCTVASKRIFRASGGHCGVRLFARQAGRTSYPRLHAH